MYQRRFPILAWKVLGVLVGTIVVMAVAFLIWIKSIEARRWGQMQQRMDELRAGWGRCEARSRIPRGQPLEGNAWLDYSSALTSARMTPDEEKAVRAFVITGNTSGLDAVRAAVKAHMKAFDLVATGARRAHIGAWGTPPPIPGAASPYSHLSFLCVAQSRLLAAEGSSRQAVEPLLDFARMMLDYVEQNPTRQLVAWPELAIPFDDLKLLSANGEMTSDELTSLERELAGLDQSFPCYLAKLPIDLFEMGKSLEDSNSTLEFLTGEKEDSFVSAWFAWSPRLMKTDAFFTFDAAVREVMRLHEGEYGEVRRAYDEIWSAAEGSRNPITRRLRPVNRWLDAASRERHAQLRLARTAVKYRATGEVLDLADPWGTVLQQEVAEGTVKFWSVEGSDTYVNPRPGTWKPSYDPSYLRVEVRR